MQTKIQPLSPEWFAYRRDRITATDAVGILGLSPYKSPLSVWARITGRDEPDQSGASAYALWGQKTEELHAAWFAEEADRKIDTQVPLHQHAEIEWLCCTPDAIQIAPGVSEEPGLLELKSPSEFKRDDWRDHPPQGYLVQLQIQLACTGLYWGTVSGLIQPGPPTWLDMERDEAFLSACLDKLERFWTHNIERDIQPEAGSSELDKKTLLRLHPKDDGRVHELSPRSADALEDLFGVKEQIKSLEARKSTLEGQIKAEMKDATWALGHGLCASWKHQTTHRKAQEARTTETRIFRLAKKLPKSLS